LPPVLATAASRRRKPLAMIVAARLGDDGQALLETTWGVDLADLTPFIQRADNVTSDRRTEFINESPTVQTDEISLSSGHLLLSRTRTASRFRSSSAIRLIQSGTTTPAV
jgi:hypothetical protein